MGHSLKTREREAKTRSLSHLQRQGTPGERPSPKHVGKGSTWAVSLSFHADFPEFEMWFQPLPLLMENFQKKCLGNRIYLKCLVARMPQPAL